MVEKGAIKVEDGKNILTVAPGEAVRNDTFCTCIHKVPFSEEKELSWRLGYFDFTNLDVRESMLELEKWYGMSDIEIYPGVDTTTHGLVKEGRIKKLEMDRLLEKLGDEHLYIWREGKTIIASPIPKKFPG
jgi:hypothetical protein